jgi:hypothetical protein
LEHCFVAPCGDHCGIKHLLFGQVPLQAMLFGDEAPRFLGLYPFEQLDADAVHLGRMQQRAFFLPPLFEADVSRVERIVAGPGRASVNSLPHRFPGQCGR